MARRPLTPEAQQSLFNESQPPGGGVRVFQSAAAFAAAAPKKKQYKRKDFSSIANRFVLETERLIEDAKASNAPADVWNFVKPDHLVALYAIFHRSVYGALPGELAGDWMAACNAAKKMLKDELDDQAVDMVAYLQWSFAREKKREQRRTAQQDGAWRLSWRWAFLKRELLTDYRVSLQRGSRPG